MEDLKSDAKSKDSTVDLPSDFVNRSSPIVENSEEEIAKRIAKLKDSIVNPKEDFVTRYPPMNDIVNKTESDLSALLCEIIFQAQCESRCNPRGISKALISKMILGDIPFREFLSQVENYDSIGTESFTWKAFSIGLLLGSKSHLPIREEHFFIKPKGEIKP